MWKFIIFSGPYLLRIAFVFLSSQPGFSVVSGMFHRRFKKEEQLVLEQGVAMPEAPMTASEPLPPALSQPATFPSGDAADEHQFHLPDNKTGSAKAGRQKVSRAQAARTPPTMLPASAGQLVTNGIGRRPLFMPALAAGIPSTSASLPHPTSVQEVSEPANGTSRSTQAYRRKRAEMEKEGTVICQRYRRKAGTTYWQCGKERLPENHRQCFGSWWCAEMARERGGLGGQTEGKRCG